MDNTCSVCIETFTKQPNKKQAKCPYCDIKACVKCTQTYLMNSNEDPHCMGCRRGWARDVMDTLLLTTWVNGEYKKHRENILVDRERSRLPAAQIIIENQKRADEYEPERKKISDEIVALGIKINTLNTRLASIQNIQATFRAGRDPFQARGSGAAGAVNQERRVFVMPCPATNCRGFLSQAYKCGVCDIHVCSECREIKGTTKDAPHTCDPATVETVRAIKKDTRPCPECGTGIFKIDGCFGKDTPILLWDGSIKLSQNIKVGDRLVGDDGNQRIVENLVSGEDTLYEIQQNNGANYIVNSKHKLVLKYSGDNKISWSEKSKNWKVFWFDRIQKCSKTKNFKITDKITKENAYEHAVEFVNNLPTKDNIEMTVDEYIKLDKWSKKYLMGYKSENGVQWANQEVSLDPYMLGLWLGDGTHINACIASNDNEIQNYMLEWCKKNDAELLHEHTVHFRIRRRGAINGKDEQRLAIGCGTSCDTCKGCKTKKMEICNTTSMELKAEKNMHKTNPFIEQLKKYNLLGNKHIPKEYLMNSREVRLKVLAGIIDTDGSVPKDQHGKRAVIVQTNKNLVNEIVVLAKSLGFVVHLTKTTRENISIFGQPPKNYSDVFKINISGEKLQEIPTLLPRKKCVGTIGNKDYMRTNINVKELEKGTYYGWVVDGNHRFLHEDFTVLRNCDQMFCTNCNTPFSWKTGQKVTTGAIHNPHYFEFLRKSNGGVMPRQPGDIPCGANLPGAWTFDREISRKYSRDKELVKINVLLYQALNTLTHIQHYEIPNLTNRAEDQDTTEYNIRYLKNEITEARWKQLLQQREKRRMRRDELRQRFEAFVGVGVDIYSTLMRELTHHLSPISTEEKAKPIIMNAYNQLVEMVKIFNTSMMEISKRYKCRVMKIDENMRRGYDKYTAGRTRKSATSSEDGSDTEEETNTKNALVRA